MRLGAVRVMLHDVPAPPSCIGNILHEQHKE